MPIQISGGVQLSGPVLLDPTGGSSPSPSGGFQGSNFGFNAGGTPDGGSTHLNVIQKFSFTSDGNATDVADLVSGRSATSSEGQSSSTSGYIAGGRQAGGTSTNTIQKFGFTSSSNASDVGDLLFAVYYTTGASSADNGYASAGYTPSNAYGNTIQKFPFASDGNATDVGDLTRNTSQGAAGQSSTDYGYASGNNPSPANVIEKFSFSSDGNATDVGDLAQAVRTAAGHSSSTDGYTSGGAGTPSFPLKNFIQKFPFASDSNASDIADITQPTKDAAGTSSTASGYSAGGTDDNLNYYNTIEKFSFSADANATDVGDLLAGQMMGSGTQY